MTTAKQLIEGQFDIRSNHQLKYIASGVALITLGIKSQDTFRKWAQIISGGILIWQGLTEKTPRA